MNLSSKEPDDNATKSLSDAAERRRQHLLSMATTEIAANPSLGERLLQFIMAAMEACWVDAFVMGEVCLNFLQPCAPMILLEGPFVHYSGAHGHLEFLVHRGQERGSS